MPYANIIGRITPAGVITEFSIATAGSYPIGITAGSDGNIWFTESETNRIGRITPQGAITEFSLPPEGAHPHNITLGSDGNLWFTDDAGTVGKITPSGVATEYMAPDPAGRPFGIGIGPDGNIWFTEFYANKIVRINTYKFDGFDRPIDNVPMINFAKAGSAIPIKWRLTDFDGSPISDPSSFKSLTSNSVPDEDFSGEPADEREVASSGASGLQYLGDGYWQFNWKTSKDYAGQCRVMVLKLADGSEHTAYFKFK